MKKSRFKKDFERRLLRLCDSLNLYFYGCTFRESNGDVHMINRDWSYLWKDADRFEFPTLYSVLSYMWCKNVKDLKKIYHGSKTNYHYPKPKSEK